MEERRIRPVSNFPKNSSWAARHLLYYVLFIALTVNSSACTKLETNHTGSKKPGGHVLRFDVELPIGNIVPNGTDESLAGDIHHFLYSYLFTLNEEGELEPDLAINWNYDHESFTWTITLREGALFHNGKPVISDDVEYSLETLLRLYFPLELSMVDRITTVSEQVLSISLKRDDPDFLKLIWPIEILPRTDTEKSGDANNPIGSGPFKFIYKKGNEEVGVIANENYYGRKPSLKGAIFYYIPDKEKSWARLISSKTDLAFGIEPPDFDIIKRYQDKFYFNTQVKPFRAVMLYNTKDPLFSDPRVRMAIAHAIDREFIVNSILKGMGVVPVGTMGYYSPFRNPHLQPIPYDPQKSLELLQEAGWSFDQGGHYLQKEGKGFEFTLCIIAGIEIHETIANYIRLCLDGIGIKVHLQSVPIHELARRKWCNGFLQAIITEFVDVINNTSNLRSFWNPQQNRVAKDCFENPQVMSLIEAAIQEKVPQKRESLLHEVDVLLTSLQPVTFLYQSTSLNVLSKRFRSPYPFSSLYSTYHYWEISPSVE